MDEYLKNKQEELRKVLSDIDLNDPATKGLFDLYDSSDEKDLEKFFSAYCFLKYSRYIKALSLRAMGAPLTEESKGYLKEMEEERQDLLAFATKYNLNLAKNINNPSPPVIGQKIATLPDVVKLISQEVDIDIELPVSIVPYDELRRLTLEGSPAIAVGQCNCRATNPGCTCMEAPYEACFWVGEPVVTFITTNNPKYRRVERDEALQIMESLHKKGFMANVVFRRDYDKRFCNICFCCDDCCIATKGVRLINEGAQMYPRMAPSGYVAIVGDHCIGCGTCEKHCRVHALHLNPKTSKAQLKFDKCMGCGVCVDLCPTKNITLRLEPMKGLPLDLDKIQVKGS